MFRGRRILVLLFIFVLQFRIVPANHKHAFFERGLRMLFLTDAGDDLDFEAPFHLPYLGSAFVMFQVALLAAQHDAFYATTRHAAASGPSKLRSFIAAIPI